MSRAARKKTTPARGGLEPSHGRQLAVPGETKVLRAVDEMRRNLRRVADAERAARIAVRNAGTLFKADDNCFAIITPGCPEADLAAEMGWRIMIVGDAKRHATSSLIERIKKPRT